MSKSEFSSTKLCECGCGTPVRGRFVSGHNKRKFDLDTEYAEHRARYEAEKPEDVPWGHCFCGCGQRTVIPKYTIRAKNQLAGEPRRLIQGHARPRYYRPPTEKPCSTCGETKPVSEFPPSKHHSSGYASQCKVCKGAGDRRYYEANKDRVAASQRRWYEANKEHKREYDKQYYKDNFDKKREQGRQWYEANIEEKREYDKQYRKDNAEHLAEVQRRYYEANKESILKYQREWFEANREYVYARGKQWREANREHMREYAKGQRAKHAEQRQRHVRKRRALQRGATGDGATLSELKEIHGETCYLCGLVEADCVDHVIPISRGGSNEPENQMPACQSCNSSKHAKTFDEYMKYLAK